LALEFFVFGILLFVQGSDFIFLGLLGLAELFLDLDNLLVAGEDEDLGLGGVLNGFPELGILLLFSDDGLLFLDGLFLLLDLFLVLALLGLEELDEALEGGGFRVDGDVFGSGGLDQLLNSLDFNLEL
jgi:hypothetical protein